MAHNPMTVRENSDVTVIDVQEDLGSYAASDLRETLEDLLISKTQKIIVNLGNVEHVNSTGVGAIVGAAKRIRQRGGDVKVCGLAENIKRTFDLTGASSVVEIYESESSAISAF